MLAGDTYATSGVVGSSISRVNMGPSDTNLDECYKFTLFKDFTISGLGRLGCGFVEDVNVLKIWKDVQHFTVCSNWNNLLYYAFLLYATSKKLNAVPIFQLFVLNQNENSAVLFYMYIGNQVLISTN